MPGAEKIRARKSEYRQRVAVGQALKMALAVVLPVALMPLSGCRASNKIAETEKIPVRVMCVELRTLKRSLDYAGNIRAREEAQVYSKVPGKIMKKVRQEGARVSKGDIIAFVDRDEVGFNYEKAPVESPLAGLVGRMYVDLGASVTPQTAIALVVDIEAVEIALDVPEKFIAQVNLGQAATLSVDAWPDEIFTGKLTKISPVMDVDTRTAPVTITIPNPGHRLKPGMFARVQLVLEERSNIPVIMKEAILGRDADSYVYVVSNGFACLRPVRMGLREGSDFEVSEGVSVGELVVIMGQQRLKDGVAVSTDEDTGINTKLPNQKPRE